MPKGPSVHYVAGSGHRPVPIATDLTPRAAHAPQARKPRGLDWSTITPRCKSCQKQSGQLNDDTLCPTCAPSPTPAETPAKTKRTPPPPAAKCSECGRGRRFLHDGVCALCRAETTPLVVQAPAAALAPPAPPVVAHAHESAAPTPADDGHHPTPAEPTEPAPAAPAPSDGSTPPSLEHATAAQTDHGARAWTILLATEDTQGDPIAAMMRRAAIAAIEALWLHWRLNHHEPTPSPSPEAGTGGGKPARPKGTPTTPKPGRQPHPTLDVDSIITAYRNGETIPKIAAAHTTARSRIRRLLLKADVQLRDDRATHSGGRNLTTLPPDLLAQLAADYNTGQTLDQVAATHHVDVKVIRRNFRENGITIRPPAHLQPPRELTAHDLADITTLYENGASIAELAARHHVRGTQIRDVLVAHHITIRNRSDAVKAQLERIKQLGLTQHDVKVWAHQQGLITKVTRGNVKSDLLVAYFTHHDTTQEISS